jgi:beta-galactosidase
MKTKLFFLFSFLLGINAMAQRKTTTLEKDWKFTKSDFPEAVYLYFDDSKWEKVTVPHDWAIYGPFDKNVDMQVVAITQNNEEIATEKTGRTGALPFIGVGWYRINFEVPEYKKGKQVLLTFDGAMSEAQVYVNGQKVGERPYGYSYFYFDITSWLKPDGENLLAVRLENRPKSSRWYPGAGIYRKVQIIVKDEVNFEHWGTFVTTPFISDEVAKVNIKTKVNGNDVKLVTTIKDADGNEITSSSTTQRFGDGMEQNLAVSNPNLWSPESPYLYTAVSRVYQNDVLKDEQTIRFGIRQIEYKADEGFFLNGKVTKFKGVCLHHDLGPLGAAINKAALRRQLTILKDMGCNAIRSAHNMPSLEQVELCDEMGFMMIAESFDEWAKPKVENGYNRFFNEWAKRDVQNLVRATRNYPSIVMWSAGNEVPDQWGNEGIKRLKFLQDLFHREDPTRLVTVGMDQVGNTLKNGFGAMLDIPGLNYRLPLYGEAQEKFPQGFILGSETASTLSSRGIYKFPVEFAKDKKYDDLQCSSYDFECCNWSNIPDDDFVWQDDYNWVIGEFVWTGFDYLGEPTPYDDFWPSRSSYFGICDLAGLPKDRYFLYRSRWNTEDETLHILPHWNWEGREGETTPVFVYTNYDSAELFINGKSQGIQKKNMDSNTNRYRLMWMDVKYEPGTLKVIAFDKQGKPVAEKEIHTAGKPHHLELTTNRTELSADGNDLAYITVSVVDKDGNLCPTADNQLQFKVTGAGKYLVACNGDATSLEQFHLPTMKTFSGKLVVTIQSAEKPGDIALEVSGKGLKKAGITIVGR